MNFILHPDVDCSVIYHYLWETPVYLSLFSWNIRCPNMLHSFLLKSFSTGRKLLKHIALYLIKLRWKKKHWKNIQIVVFCSLYLQAEGGGIRNKITKNYRFRNTLRNIKMTLNFWNSRKEVNLLYLRQSSFWCPLHI